MTNSEKPGVSLKIRDAGDHESILRKDAPRQYVKPRLRKLTPEQAKLVLLGHSTTGSKAAYDLLDLIFRPADLR